MGYGMWRDVVSGIWDVAGCGKWDMGCGGMWDVVLQKPGNVLQNPIRYENRNVHKIFIFPNFI